MTIGSPPSITVPTELVVPEIDTYDFAHFLNLHLYKIALLKIKTNYNLSLK